MLEEYDGFCQELTSLLHQAFGTAGDLFRNMVLRGKEESVQVGRKKMV